MKRPALVGAIAGVTIPTLWMIAYHSNSAFADWWPEAPGWIENARLLLWPTAIVLIADPLDKNVALWIISAALNGGIYALVGAIFGVLISRK